jgi:hypothetical protein
MQIAQIAPLTEAIRPKLYGVDLPRSRRIDPVRKSPRSVTLTPSLDGDQPRRRGHTEPTAGGMRARRRAAISARIAATQR